MVVCEKCDKLVVREKATKYNPFAEEVYGKKIPLVLCEECCKKMTDDI